MQLNVIPKQTDNNYVVGQIPEDFYSVEFSMKFPKLLYQFKIWNSDTCSMYIVIKEDSDILAQLEEGGVFKTRYYSSDTLNPTVDLQTKIKDISKDENGRFKGHYRVGLDILDATEPRIVH